MKSPQELIKEIIESGKRQRDIVANTGISKSFVSEMLSGISRKPSYMVMSLLIEYHKQVMQQKRRQDKKKELTEA